VRRPLVALLLLAAAWIVFGAGLAWQRARRGDGLPRPAAAAEVRGAYHVHTTASDGRGTLDEVARAAREAGLAFVVVTDHNVRFPEAAEYRDGVLVVPATEVSTAFGHVVALGTGRALTGEERAQDPLGAIAALGGEAILAHPLHPRRPFTGFGRGPWRGFEIVSNDTSWYRVVGEREVGKVALAALSLPWDGARAVLALGDDPSDELARFDERLREAGKAEARRPALVLLCSADAHGYPGYRAAFEAFSMHLPVRLTGDAGADARAVERALTDGSASCVFDGVAPASVRLEADRAAGTLALALRGPQLAGVEVRVLRDGAPAGALTLPADAGSAVSRALPCGAAPCPPGDYRVEILRAGRPWIFTNPVSIE
jgi:hypothetical protein